MKATRSLGLLVISLALAAGARADDETDLASQLDAAREGHHWTDVGDLAQKLIAKSPGNWEYLRALAESQFHTGDFADAQANYQKAVDAAANLSDPKAKAALGEMLIDEGDCLQKTGKFPEAVAAYDRAAPLSSDPASVYFNIATAWYVRGEKEKAIAYSDKTIKANPKHADAYYLKGSLQAGKATSDPDTGKIVLPDGTVDALNKYLELKPNGSHASAVKNMLRAFAQQD
jgi:tetratricopeptide (TPR) repeat protein